MKKAVIIFALVLGVVGVFFIGRVSENTSLSDLINDGGSEADIASAGVEIAADHPLLAKRIFQEDPNDPIINFSALRKSLNDYFDQNSLDGGLYFEYLPTGTAISIDGEDREVAASLIKLPAAMELYKDAENNKVNLDDDIQLKSEWLNNGFGTLYEKGEGYSLSLRDAAKIMLEESDNTALKAVGSTIMGKASTDETPFNFLDADYNFNPDLTVSISPRSYSSFLKCLYFSCYLNKENSEEILDYLAHTEFHDRLEAGIADKDIEVAHKVGNNADNVQSDCGIIYVPRRNYVLCVMIKGEDNADTSAKIAELSRQVYEYIKSK